MSEEAYTELIRYYQCLEEVCVQIYLCTYYILIYNYAYNFHWNWYCYKNHHRVQKYDSSKAVEDYLWDRTYGTRCMGALNSNVLQLISIFIKSQITNPFLETSSSSYSVKGVFHRPWSEPCSYLRLGRGAGCPGFRGEMEVAVAHFIMNFFMEVTQLTFNLIHSHFVN